MRQLTFLCVLVSSVSSAQYLYVEDYTRQDAYNNPSTFPIVKARENKQNYGTFAAERINTYLQYNLLEKIFRREGDTALFSEVFPTEEFFGGQSEFAYEINANTDKLFTITIEYTGTGAYSEYYSSTYNFTAETGEHLTLDDLFESGEKLELGTEVRNHCAETIRQFLATQDTTLEYWMEQREMYEDCLPYFSDEYPGFPSNQFMLTDSTIVFFAERCSNHMMAALDDLWSFEVIMNLDDLRPYLNKTAENFLFNGGKWVHPEKRNYSNKVLEGSIGGKYPITAIINLDQVSSEIYGTYWYTKYKKPITVHGSILDTGDYELFEELEGKETARMVLHEENGKLSGNWYKTGSTRGLSIILHAQ